MPKRKGPDLTGQSAIVTGANSGIGEGIAKSLASAGAAVAVNYVVNPESAEKVAGEIKKAGGKAVAVQADVSNEAQVQKMFQEAIKEFGAVDILVNNAGIQNDANFVDMTMEQWSKVINVNLTGYFLCAREAARAFIKQGLAEKKSCALGKIIFVSSVHEVIPWAKHCNYAASKGGIMLLMKSIAQELAPKKIRVNSVCPGAIKTPINQSVWSDPKGRAKMLELIPYNRIGEVEDVGSAVVWLSSDESEYVNGTSLYVDGGMTLYPGFATGG